MPTREAARHDAERHPQGVHRARELHLPARADDAADDGPVRLLPREHPEVEHDLDLRLPHPREGLLGGAGGRVHARQRASPTCRRRSTPASTSTSSPRGWRSSSTATTTSSRRSRSSAPPAGCGRTIMRERFGAHERASRMMLRFHTQTGGVTLTAQQPENNIVARRAAGLRRGAAAARSRCTPTASTRRSRCRPSAAAKIALRTQQIIAARVRRDRHRRPVRRLVLRRVADRRDRARAQELIDKVDELGGSSNAIEFITGEIEESAWGYQERYRIGQDIVVGVNEYVEEELEVGPPARRPGVRARAGRAPEGVQGRPRPGASSSSRLEELRDAARGHRQPAAASARR